MAATACSDDCISLSSTVSLCKEKDVAHFKDAAIVDCVQMYAITCSFCGAIQGIIVLLQSLPQTEQIVVFHALPSIKFLDVCNVSGIFVMKTINVSNKEDTMEKANTMIKQSTKQSARQSLQEDEEENETEKTSEFKSVVNKRLTEILDQQMELTSRKPLYVNVKKDTNEEGIKLFSSSTGLLSHADHPYIMPVRKKRTYSTSSNSSEDERLAESVVTCDFIFHESRTCDSKLDVLSNGLSDRPEQQDKVNSGDVITMDKSKKKVKKKKKHKHVKDDDT